MLEHLFRSLFGSLVALRGARGYIETTCCAARSLGGPCITFCVFLSSPMIHPRDGLNLTCFVESSFHADNLPRRTVSPGARLGCARFDGTASLHTLI